MIRPLHSTWPAIGQAMRSARAAAACLLAALTLGCLHPASAQLSLAPIAPKFRDIVRLDQEGYGDSARTMIASLLAHTSSTDPAYAEALYTAGTVAKTGDEMRTWFRRVVVEYGASEWADKAQLRLAQLAYGNGDMNDVVLRVTRIFADYPSSPVLPSAALWGSRAAFEQQKTPQACEWLRRGLAAVGEDLELRNQLQFSQQRCSADTAVSIVPPATPPSGTDTAARRPDRAATKAAASPWRVQVAAIADQAAVRRLVRQLEAAGFTAYTVAGTRGLTKVQAGPFTSRAAAAANLARIKTVVGGPAFVTEAP